MLVLGLNIALTTFNKPSIQISQYNINELAKCIYNVCLACMSLHIKKWKQCHRR